jgi:hypothetical protein
MQPQVLDHRMRAMQTLRVLLGRYLSVCEQALANGCAHEGCPVLCDLAQHVAYNGETLKNPTTWEDRP